MTSSPNPPKAGRRPKTMTIVRWVLLAAGVALLGHLLNRIGLRDLYTQAMKMGWSFLIILAVYSGYHALRTLSWKLCLRLNHETLRFLEGARIWLAGEAVGYLSFSWSGEAFRAAALRKRIPLSKGLSAVIISRTLYSYAALAVMTAGLTTGAIILEPGAPRTFAGAGAVVLAVVLVFPFLWGTAAFGFFRSLNARFEARPEDSVAGRVHRFFRQLGESFRRVVSADKGTLRRLLLMNLAASSVGVVEIYVLLRALDPNITLATALVVEAGSKMISVTGHFIPGNVGVREAGMSLLLQQFGFPPSTGVALAFLRRGRQVFWVSLGSLIMIHYGLRPPAAPPEMPTAGGAEIRPGE